MDELVKLVVEKTNVSEQVARTAIDTVLRFLKNKLPAPIASQIDGAIQGGGVASVLGGLGGLLKR
ncbi:MAG: hypothetical protein V1772_02705 [Chloroflexota bacterium]